MTLGDVVAFLGLAAAFACAFAVGWYVRDAKAEREALDRCLDCDALKRKGGLIVINGELRRAK